MADPPLPEHLHLIGRAFPTLRVIVLSDREEPEEVAMALRQGVQGYVPTSLAPRLVIGAIRIVLGGGTFYPADMLVRAYRLIGAEVAQAPRLARLARAFGDDGEPEHQGQWPPRQLEVLCLLAQGKANRQIAESLAIEEGTVKVHLREIMRKLGVANRTQAALAARRLRIPAIKDTLAEITAGSNAAATRLDGPRPASWLNRSANVDLIACPAE